MKISTVLLMSLLAFVGLSGAAISTADRADALPVECMGGVLESPIADSVDHVQPMCAGLNGAPMRLRIGSDRIDLSQFTVRQSGGVMREPRGQAWKISPERSGTPHGGSAWKLLNPKGKRIATLDSGGKYLRN